MRRKAVMLISFLILLILIFYLLNFKTPTNDGYTSFKKLELKEAENDDYTIHFEESDSEVLLLAIHGGGIEPGTTELIQYLATRNNYSYYSFNGIKQQDNQKMHITSTSYDEPQALDIVENSLITLSFHGYNERKKKHTYIGGLDEDLSGKVNAALKEAGFSVSAAPKKFNGKKKENIVNKNKQKQGVQLEISTAQRKAFFKDNDFSAENRKQKEAEFYQYTGAIEAALNN